MSILIILLAIIGGLYCLLTYAIAAYVIKKSDDDGDYDNNAAELWEDIVVLVFAPILVPYQIFVNN